MKLFQKKDKKKMEEKLENVNENAESAEDAEQSLVTDVEVIDVSGDLLKEANDKYLRVLADFDNFRKRTERERSSYFENGARDVLLKILPTLDSLERALTQDDEGEKFRCGVEMIYKNLKNALEAIGVTPIAAVGEKFDANAHNAVMHVEDDGADENVVIEELQKGYSYKDKPLRYSMVKVAN